MKNPSERTDDRRTISGGNNSRSHEKQILRVRLACLAAVGALALGFWANMPYLVVEHRRLELWKLEGLWIGDIVGLLWFLRFAFVHAVLGEPLASLPLIDGRARLKSLIRIGVTALLLDLTFTLFLMHDERSAYAHGKTASAEVVAIQEHKRPDATGYDIDCRFLDGAGSQQQAHLRVLAAHHAFPTTLPQAAVQALMTKEHGRIPIRYDAQFLARAWIDGLGWEDENGIYWFSIGVLMLQAGGTLLFVLLLKMESRIGPWPWWWDFYKVLPFAAETFCMLMMGSVDRLMDAFY